MCLRWTCSIREVTDHSNGGGGPCWAIDDHARVDGTLGLIAFSLGMSSKANLPQPMSENLCFVLNSTFFPCKVVNSATLEEKKKCMPPRKDTRNDHIRTRIVAIIGKKKRRYSQLYHHVKLIDDKQTMTVEKETQRHINGQSTSLLWRREERGKKEWWRRV